jgi:hypothetical protein
LGQAIGAKERQGMKKKIFYMDEPMGDLEVVADFLPSPAELAFREGCESHASPKQKQLGFFQI